MILFYMAQVLLVTFLIFQWFCVIDLLFFKQYLLRLFPYIWYVDSINEVLILIHFLYNLFLVHMALHRPSDIHGFLAIYLKSIRFLKITIIFCGQIIMQFSKCSMWAITEISSSILYSKELHKTSFYFQKNDRISLLWPPFHVLFTPFIDVNNRRKMITYIYNRYTLNTICQTILIAAENIYQSSWCFVIIFGPLIRGAK